ncbi:MAG: S49 family peptidase [Acetobacteraceae bacterium]
MDLFGQFVTMVATARHMDEARVRALADGRAYTGQQAIGLGLVDEIGGESRRGHGCSAKRKSRRICPSPTSSSAACTTGRSARRWASSGRLPGRRCCRRRALGQFGGLTHSEAEISVADQGLILD